MSIEELVEVSRYYGVNPNYVIAGGGNSSFKDGDTLYIKRSGQAMADAVEDTFVRLDRKALAKMWEKTYPDEDSEREKAVLADLMASRMPGEEDKRPSVETMLHDILPFDYVVHLHPALVNGLTCSQLGEIAMTEIFDEEAIWIPLTNPGYILAKKVKTALNEYNDHHSGFPQIIFLQNHGVFVGSNSVEYMKDIYRDIMWRLEKRIKRRPDFSVDESIHGEGRELSPEAPKLTLSEISSELEEISGGKAVFFHNREISVFVKDKYSFEPVSSAFTPDHIVYAGSDPLFTGAKTSVVLRQDWKAHTDATGRPPKIAAIQGMGIFGCGPTENAAELALELFKDAVKIAVFSESFGGHKFMTRDNIDFINNWEVEQFRSKVSVK